jgi:hypothetical protein
LEPTAVQLAERLHETASKETMVLLLELGLDRIDQAMPFHDSIRVIALPRWK